MGAKNKISERTDFTSILNKIFFASCLVTLVFNTKFFDPFNSPKFIITIFLSVWAFGHLVNVYRLNLGHPNLLQHKVLAVLSLFMLGQLISFLATDNKIYGIVGDVQRRNSFVLYLAFVIIALLIVKTFRYNDVIKFLKYMIILNLVLSVYGLVQILGGDFVNWVNPYNSMISTLGNPNFASAILAVFSIMSLGSLMIGNLDTFYKVIAISASIISVYAILKSQSRQGIIVLLVGIFMGLTFTLIRYFPRFRLLLIFLFSSLMMMGAAGMLQVGPLAKYLYKESVSVRGYYWRAGFEMFQNNFFTGVGQDSYGHFFKQYREVSYALKYGFDITSSNAHNVPIQIFATAGVLAGMGYIFLLGLVFVSGVKILQTKNDAIFKLGLILFSGWIGFQAQSFISIDNIGISIWGWLLGSAILALRAQLMSENDGIQVKTVIKSKSNSVNINLFAPITSLILLIPTIFLVTLLYRAETDMVKIRAFSDPSNVEFRQIANTYALKIIDNPVADPYYKFQAALSMIDMGNEIEGYRQILDLSSQNPRDLNLLNFIAFYENKNGNYNNEVGARYLIKKYDPWNLRNLLDLIKGLKQLGRPEEAEVIREFILSNAPGTEIATESSKIDLNS